jgi:poly(A) polymerase
LFDEMVKLLLSGYGERAWRLLADSPLRAVLFPGTAPDDPLMAQAMHNTDERIAQDKPVTPGFMLAVLLWKDYQARTADHEVDAKPAEARFLAAAEALSAQQQVMSIPKRFSQFVRDVWMLQERLLERRPRNITRIFEHQRFRAGYDFLLLRGQVGEEAVVEAADWWTRYQEVDGEQRAEMAGNLSGRKPRRRRKKKKSSPQAPDSLECP